eukprot:CAMPEP_0194275024 /NCGR_PEP_ID=MMETSP0169-20130528/7969_1 /TAXON_ID=218684 /ORGANISM="Corethron pennatum, Strain L29A3" /LENGTH=102 /DNA_ID=CAMNT_0039018385 /DNA_START=578 /DNA_END=886 /DNA_ORIENTATION=+
MSITPVTVYTSVAVTGDSSERPSDSSVSALEGVAADDNTGARRRLRLEGGSAEHNFPSQSEASTGRTPENGKGRRKGAFIPRGRKARREEVSERAAHGTTII